MAGLDWRSAPASLTIAGEVHLWRVDLAAGDAADGQAAARSLLPPDELARADRFVFARDREHFLTAHAGLRTILSRYLGVAARDIELIDAPSGKPGLRGRGPRFSLSHSADLALVALAARAEIGVDVERVREVDIDDVAQQFLASDEQALLEAQADDAGRRGMFFRIWTRREALLKADGRGIGAAPLAAPDDWSLYDLAPGHGYVGALAISVPTRDIRCYDLPAAAWRSPEG